MELLLGKPVAESIKSQVREKVSSFSRHPSLVILLNKEDTSSIGYVNSLVKTASSVDIDARVVEMEQDEETYLKTIASLNEDEGTDAVLITRPLNKSLNENKIISSLDYRKDADAMNPYALGLLLSGNEEMVPNTPMAMIKMLEYYHIPLSGKKALVAGRSLSVGKPMALLLLNRNATVTIAHSKTENLNDELKNYDIVIAAIGKAHFLDGSRMKEGAVAIDAGIHYTEDGIFGDIKPDDKLSYISKVPGGVGIITSACLMDNVVSCYERLHK